MNVEEKNMRSTIKSVDKALEVLEAFSELNDGIKLSSLSEKLNMNKPGVYRLLQVFDNIVGSPMKKSRADCCFPSSMPATPSPPSLVVSGTTLNRNRPVRRQ